LHFAFPRNQFLDFAQLLLAEKYLLAHEKRRRAERAALDRGLGVLDQFGLDLGFLRARKQLGAVEAGCAKRFRRYLWVVHLLRLDPHVMKRRLDIFLKHAFQLRGDGGAHQVERVDREERIPDVRLDLESASRIVRSPAP
jgi:hypothetical protein